MPKKTEASGRKRGRPALPPEQRKRGNVTIRFRDRIKEALQEAGASEGRSLSEEIESRLERSLQEEDAYGGRETAKLFQLMGAAVQIIEGNMRESYLTNQDCFLVVRSAWLKLISDFGPKLDEAYLKSIGMPDIGLDLPPAPVPPELAIESGAPQDSEEYERQIEAYERKRKAYDREYAEWRKQSDERAASFKKGQEMARILIGMGEETATGLFPPRRTK